MSKNTIRKVLGEAIKTFIFATVLFAVGTLSYAFYTEFNGLWGMFLCFSMIGLYLWLIFAVSNYWTDLMIWLEEDEE